MAATTTRREVKPPHNRGFTVSNSINATAKKPDLRFFHQVRITHGQYAGRVGLVVEDTGYGAANAVTVQFPDGVLYSCYSTIAEIWPEPQAKEEVEPNDDELDIDDTFDCSIPQAYCPHKDTPGVLRIRSIWKNGKIKEKFYTYFQEQSDLPEMVFSFKVIEEGKSYEDGYTVSFTASGRGDCTCANNVHRAAKDGRDCKHIRCLRPYHDSYASKTDLFRHMSECDEPQEAAPF